MTDARERARLAAAHVEGWLSEAQGAALFDAAAAATGRGAIVEIGSWKGRSTVWLGHGARLAGRRVYAVDPHEHSKEDPSARTYDTFMRNLTEAGVADVVDPMVMTSADAAAAIPGGVEVLFIDGDHSDAAARSDADIWFPRLIDGATVLMHDVATASYTGPRRVFRELICWNSGFDRIGNVGSMGVARKVARRGPFAAVRGWGGGVALYLLDVKRGLRRLRGQ